VLRIGACFVCFERVHGPGAVGDRGFAGAAVTYRRRLLPGVSSSGSAATIPGVLGSHCISGRCLGCPRSGWPPGRCSPRAPGLPTTAVPRHRWCWVARWSAAGSGPDRAPSRWLSMPAGRPKSRLPIKLA